MAQTQSGPSSGDAERRAALQAQLARGLHVHKLGRLVEAEQIYRSILSVAPAHFEAMRALGAVFLQCGQYEAAERQIALALRINPEDTSALVNLGLALKQLGRHDEALANCDRAIALDPGRPDAHCNRGLVLRELKLLDESLATFDKAIALRPTFADAISNRGVVLKELGRLPEALESMDRALALNPRACEIHNNRGLVLSDLKQFDAALASFDRAIALNPDYADAFNNQGLALDELERFEKALASFDRAAALRPGSAEIWHNRVFPLTALNRLGEALATCDRAIALESTYASAHYNRGRVLDELGRVDEALASFDKALALNPGYHEVYSDRGLILLQQGRFSKGWHDTEHRWLTKKFRDACRANVYPGQLSLGAGRDDLRNKRVLAVAEQGVGDEIMFSSMIPDLMRDASEVAVECDPRLGALFARSFPGIGILRREHQPNWSKFEYDCLFPIGSLGRLYRNAPEDFPARDRHLVPDASIAARWTDRLSGLRGLKVGLSWQGGVKRTHAARRSISLSDLRPILEQERVDFVSLQYGDTKDEVERANALLTHPIVRFDPREIDDFDQLAGLVSALDLVISVQTALVHLCGAIGRPCWVMVPRPAEWRYGNEGSSMPWYHSVKLYRQAETGDWNGTIAAVAADLAALMKEVRA